MKQMRLGRNSFEILYYWYYTDIILLRYCRLLITINIFKWFASQFIIVKQIKSLKICEYSPSQKKKIYMYINCTWKYVISSMKIT